MKAIRPVLVGALAILVGSAMLVSAIVLSNVLTYTNQVPGITLRSTWSDGPKVLGAENDFTVSYESSAGTPSAVVTFEFNMTGIVPTDVTLAYNSSAGWVNAIFDPNGPDTIVGQTMTIVVGPTSGVFEYKLWYNTPGTYTMKIWAG